MRYDIAIAGANHTGLALALSLRRLLGPGVRIVLLDRHPLESGSARPPDPRAFALSAGSRRLLEALGIWERLSPPPEPVLSIDITDSSLEHAIRPVLLNYANRIGGGEPATFIVEAEALRCALLEEVREAPWIEVAIPAAVTGLRSSPLGVEVDLSSGTTIKADLLVAADGASSTVRDLAGIKTVSWRTGQVGIVTIVEHERPHGGRAVQHFLPSGPFAILPLTGNRSCITWSETDAQGRGLVAGDDTAFAAALERRFDYRLGAIKAIGRRMLWSLDLHLARALVTPRLALAGDAARRVHPIAGQGLNLGLRDVAALAECVSDALRLGLSAGDVTALERYEQWRRFDAGSSAAVYAAINGLFSNDSTLLRAARGVGLGLVDRAAGLKSMLVMEAAGLTGDVPMLMRDLASEVPAA